MLNSSICLQYLLPSYLEHLITYIIEQVQTEDEIHEDIQLYEDDSPELAKFLLRMEPLVLKELQKNKRSHAFDGKSSVIGRSNLFYCDRLLLCTSFCRYCVKFMIWTVFLIYRYMSISIQC